MEIEKAVYQVLAASATLTALCPAAKIYPQGDWQNIGLPYIVHFGVATSPTQMYSGLASLEMYEFYQVSCYAATQSAARGMADAVKRAMDGVHELGSPVEDSITCFYRNERTLPYDFEVRAAHIAVDFRIAHTLS